MDSGDQSFRKIARLWSVVFLLVGILFLLFPGLTAERLSDLSFRLGLRGEILYPSGTVGHVLSLALMGTLFLLADSCARHPDNRTPYRILLIAKIISTAGFLFLARNGETAWLLPAAGDGFVALTLWGSYRKSLSIHSLGWHRAYKGRPPHYEVWFGKVNIRPGEAFWFRYSLLDGVKREAATWALLFQGERLRTGKTIHNLNDLSQSHPVFHLKNNLLGIRHAVGQAGPVSWDLEWSDSGRRFRHGPPVINRLRLAKSRYSSHFLDVRFTGKIHLKTKERLEEISLAAAPGMLGHIEGSKQAEQWAWVHCNQFEGNFRVAFEGLTAQVRMAGRLLPPLSSFVLFTDQKTYRFNSLQQAREAQSEWNEEKWTFSATSDDVELKGEAQIPSRGALVAYTDTDGSPLWCRNTKLASLTLHLKDPSQNLEKTFVAKGTAAFEVVNRLTPSEKVDL